tara:strand:- start:228 stop:524 length:297 start_codon:yes stop_codon:yes gene_type:complete
MDIDKVIENLREAKRKSRCPKGFKYSKKLKSCIPIRKKGKYGIGGYYMGGHGRGDDDTENKNGKNGNGNGHGNGNGNGHSNGGNGGGNGNGGNGGGGE